MFSKVFFLLIWCYVPSMGKYVVTLAYRISWMKKQTIHYKATMKNMDKRPRPYQGSNLRSHFLNSLRQCKSLDSTMQYTPKTQLNFRHEKCIFLSARTWVCTYTIRFRRWGNGKCNPYNLRTSFIIHLTCYIIITSTNKRT